MMRGTFAGTCGPSRRRPPSSTISSCPGNREKTLRPLFDVSQRRALSGRTTPSPTRTTAGRDESASGNETVVKVDRERAAGFPSALMRGATALVLSILSLSTLGAAEPRPDVEAIVDRAIEVHGGDRFDHSTIRFEFRGEQFVIWRDDGEFRYEKRISKDGREIRDVLTNEGFHREANGRVIELEPDVRRHAVEVLSSVVMFALLPYRLDKPTAVREYDGAETIRGEPYDRIHVTFRDVPELSDRDRELEVWFSRKTGDLDFFAFTSNGVRFREAFETVEAEGIRLNNYVNYIPDPRNLPLEEVERQFVRGELVEVSKIVLENLEVELH